LARKSARRWRRASWACLGAADGTVAEPGSPVIRVEDLDPLVGTRRAVPAMRIASWTGAAGGERWRSWALKGRAPQWTWFEGKVEGVEVPEAGGRESIPSRRLAMSGTFCSEMPPMGSGAGSFSWERFVGRSTLVPQHLVPGRDHDHVAQACLPEARIAGSRPRGNERHLDAGGAPTAVRAPRSARCRRRDRRWQTSRARRDEPHRDR